MSLSLLRGSPQPTRWRTLLLACGGAAALVYGTADVLSALAWDGYSYLDQTISELGAIEAPSRQVFGALMAVHTVLLFAFSWGIWRSAGGDHRLAVVAGLLVGVAVVGYATPPMHVRGDGPMAVTDILHIAGTAASVLLIVTAMTFAARSQSRAFRLYSVATITAMLAFGALAGMQGADLAAHLPTPRMGLWERISVGAYLLWLGVLSGALVQRKAPSS